MTEKSFKFRYTNEIVGSFVLFALMIMIIGIFVAGRAQGWFERKAILHTTFTTEKGAFGLREGDEVRIRDTVAGSVGKIVPVEDGTMQTTFQIKHQFLSHLRKGSVAKVQKKFGFAGDSIVEIETGKGEPLKDGDSIECKKDEELMDTARKALSDVQDVVMPIMKEIRTVLEHMNKITGGIENGKGLAGTILKDEELVKESRRIVSNINSLLLGTSEAVNETRKLIKGVQKHWLWRKYMDKDKGPEFLVQAGLNSTELDSDIKHFKSELDAARTANDSIAISHNSYNLAVCAMEKGETQQAISLIHESRAELSAMKKDTLCTYVLEAQVLKKAGKIKEALAVAQTAEGMFNRSTDRAVELQCRIVTSDLMMDDGDIVGVKSRTKKIESLADKVESPVIKSMAAGFSARLNMAENNPADAGTRYDIEADLLRTACFFPKMAESLEFAGNAYGLAKNYSRAADRYFRAGRSLFSSGSTESAVKNLKLASEMAKMANDQPMLVRITEFQQEVEKRNDIAK